MEDDDFNNSKMKIMTDSESDVPGLINLLKLKNTKKAQNASEYTTTSEDENKVDIKKENIKKETEKKITKIKETENNSLKNSFSVIQVPISTTDENKDSYKNAYPYNKQNTIKEPIKTTVYRDLFMIYTKIKIVATPFWGANEKKKYYIKQWDLWGPLLLNLLLACTLAISSDDKSNMVILVFSIFWVGGTIIYLNANFLGVKISLFQLLCLFGYCLFPLNLSALIFVIIKMDFIRIIIICFACYWSIMSSRDFMKNLVQPSQRILVSYPCILFYLYFSFLILTTK